MTTEEDISALMTRGFGQLEAGHCLAALETARDLNDARHTSAYEIAAFALRGQGDLDGAIAKLEEGVASAPAVWRLWELLAHLRVESGDVDGARSAYERAEALPEAPVASIRLHRCEAYTRALVTAREGEGRLEPSAEEAIAAEAQQLAEEAAGRDGDVGRAMWVLRQLRDEQSPQARHYVLLVRGRWPHEVAGAKGPLGFHRSFSVVADSPEEALSFARVFEPEEVRASLTIDSIEDREAASDLHKGVYERHGRAFFPEEQGT